MTARRERHWGRPGWWVFDAPVLRDPLWWGCVVAAVASGAWVTWSEPGGPATAAVVAGLQGWLSAAVTFGSIRAYRRARAGVGTA